MKIFADGKNEFADGKNIKADGKNNRDDGKNKKVGGKKENARQKDRLPGTPRQDLTASRFNSKTISRSSSACPARRPRP